MSTSYEEQAATAHDPGFVDRITAAGVRQALTFINHTNPEFNLYAKAVIASEANARQLVWPVAAEPDMTTDSTDPEILAAVQAVWPLVGASYVPAP